MFSLLSCAATQDPKYNGQWGPALVTQHVHRLLPMSRRRLCKFKPSSYLTLLSCCPSREQEGWAWCHVTRLWHGSVTLWTSCRHAGICGSVSDVQVLTKSTLVQNWDIDHHGASRWWCNANTALWLVSIKHRRTVEVDLSAVSPPGGYKTASSFLYRDVKKTKWAYLFIWPPSERLIAAGGIGAGWSAGPTGRSNVLRGLIWTQQAAVMGSGMSGGEGEVGVYVTHKHQCTSEWARNS